MEGGCLRELRAQGVKIFAHKQMVTAEMQCSIRVKSQFPEKENAVLLIEEFPSLVLNKKTIMLQHLIVNFRSIICQVVAYGRLKTMQK